MGKKSRIKKERNQACGTEYTEFTFKDFYNNQESNNKYNKEVENDFQQAIIKIQTIFAKYKPFDIALAISISDLWPANVASPLKHIFAWAVLINMDTTSFGNQQIRSYDEFKLFTETLYTAWPSFSMMEDYVPEADWGQVKVQLKNDFVAMFYGSAIERTPDFITAFRITQASNQLALADMDLAIMVQNHIINCLPEIRQSSIPEISPGHIELPSKEFWLQCRQALLSAENKLVEWRTLASGRLDIEFGKFKATLNNHSFCNAWMEGTIFPIIGIIFKDQWLPVCIRNAPSNTIDLWAKQTTPQSNDINTHIALANFIQKRFRDVTLVGPLIFCNDKYAFNLSISCLIKSTSHIYLIIACKDSVVNDSCKIAQNIYSTLETSKNWFLKQSSGRAFTINDNIGNTPSAEYFKIIIVPTLASTAPGFYATPEHPIRMISLPCFITIFDTLKSLDELERFWNYVDEHYNNICTPIGLADIFASFRDSNEVLIAGAISPSLLFLDPHWGSNWRYRELSSFWSKAPPYFPDNSTVWVVEDINQGSTRLYSQHNKAVAYSVTIASCTVQILTKMENHLSLQNYKVLDLFAQVLSDRLIEHLDLISELILFQCSHIVIQCIVTPLNPCSELKPINSSDYIISNIILESKISDQQQVIKIEVNVPVVQAGLTNSQNISFEIECLIISLNAIYKAYNLQIPDNLFQQLRDSANKPPRHRIQIIQQETDVPENANPIVPLVTEYKLARRQLAHTLQDLNLIPGRYDLTEAKIIIDAAKESLRIYIEHQIEMLGLDELINVCIEQHDMLLSKERLVTLRIRQSLNIEVEYDRQVAIVDADKEFTHITRNYRYLLEKALSSEHKPNRKSITESILRELIALIDWYIVLAQASDILHNEVDAIGVEIDEFFLPSVSYSDNWKNSESSYSRECAQLKLGVGIYENDRVEGNIEELIENKKIQNAFCEEFGFELKHLLQSLAILSQPVRNQLAEQLSFSYISSPQNIITMLHNCIEDISIKEVTAIVEFLTLVPSKIRRLSNRDIDEGDVPFWEHNKRLHRYTIRPLVPTPSSELRWGAEATERALNIWTRTVRDGYLPADFNCPKINDLVREIKESIEKQLEIKTEQVCQRFTPYVMRNVNFFRRFKQVGFEDVGDFDILSYWPEINTFITIECKYNRPPYCLKDSRRLRDQIFGKSETDRKGQFSHIVNRRDFLKKHRSQIIELLKWPEPTATEKHDFELYVSRDIYFWMIHPPYFVPTIFIRIDTLDDWLKKLKSSTP